MDTEKINRFLNSVKNSLTENQKNFLIEIFQEIETKLGKDEYLQELEIEISRIFYLESEIERLKTILSLFAPDCIIRDLTQGDAQIIKRYLRENYSNMHEVNELISNLDFFECYLSVKFPKLKSRPKTLEQLNRGIKNAENKIYESN
jgi:hypothetical protein